MFCFRLSWSTQNCSPRTATGVTTGKDCNNARDSGFQFCKCLEKKFQMLKTVKPFVPMSLSVKDTIRSFFFRGVHLKDLVFFQLGIPDKCEGHSDLINVRKMAQLSVVFSELMRVQTATLQVQPNMDMASMIRVRNVKL